MRSQLNYWLSTMNCNADEEQRRNREISRNIDRQIKIEKNKRENEPLYNLLLLGTGEAGKTTFVKQMRISNGREFSPEEKRFYRINLIKNVVDSIKQLIEGVELLKFEYDNDDCLDTVAPRIKEYDHAEETLSLKPHIISAIKTLWADPAVQDSYKHRHNFQLTDAAQYYLDNVDRFNQSNFEPSHEDILMSRWKTTGIVEHQFSMTGLTFQLIDVGGQRGERKKWIQAFQDVTAVLFISALSEYNQVLEEDKTTNRLLESLNLFGTIVANPYFLESGIILFLNKEDIFKSKIEFSPLADYLESYKGPEKDANSAKQHIREQFEKASKENSKKKFYSFFTVATNENNTTNAFNSVKAIIAQRVMDFTNC